jgi:uncharacterized protein (DUF58 family)
VRVPEEVLKKVQQVEIRTKKLVDQILTGEYKTAFKGQGMTFADFREYVPGDDVRSISWTQSAKTGKTFIKTYEEERELTLVLAVDVSGSTESGSHNLLKGETIAMVASVLGMSAVKNQDQVGLVLFSNEVEKYIPAQKGRSQVQRILRDIFYHKPLSRRTSLATVCRFLSSILKKRSHVFLLSDFQDEGYETALKFLAKKNHVVAGIFSSEIERGIEGLGLLEIEHPETGEIFLFDSDSRDEVKALGQIFKRKQDDLKRKLRGCGVDVIEMSSDDFNILPLVRYFESARA